MSSPERSRSDYAWIFAKGMGMGAADVVPGVSGGTVAFITGIYDELLGSIKSVDLKALSLLKSFDIKGLWLHINGGFLLCLMAGILSSVLSLAQIVSYLLEHQPILLNAFFIGLILASTGLVMRQVGQWNVLRWVLFVVGVVAVASLGGLRPVNVELQLHFVFLAGSIAICAMILPGISGSFILLLLGMYAPVIGAIKDLDLTTIAVFGAGCAIGLMVFVRLLLWLLKNFHDSLLALLCGVLLGSLWIIWPWKQGGTKVEGKEVLLSPENFLPSVTESQDLALLGAFAAICGFLLVYLIEKSANRLSNRK